MSPAAIAALAAAALAAGVLLIVTGLVGTRRPAAPPAATPSRLAAIVGIGVSSRQRRSRQALIALAVAATAGVWLLTGWPVGGLIAGLAVLGMPWLFTVGSAERQMIDRLEAVETWTRRLKDLVRTGHGLISAIVTSARTAPPGIVDEVAELAAELQTGTDPQRALDRFADQLADFKADEVIAALKLHAGDRGQRLSDVLDSVAGAAAKEVVMRRGVAAKRAEPRFVTRFMTALIAIVLIVMFSNGAYAQPYGDVVGQLVLFAATLLLVGMLVWIRRLTQPPQRRRFLGSADDAHNGPVATPPQEVMLR
ncbi:type II secretion system F family protein [Phytohabitans aurantiacus]|uniref:Type II secretion system protein n=1 Tax=Phytohabitans aurantiacus TaxID=3016789 RepID=A0ABQ5R4M9_9ACTN|nr:type II secretion system F family protein [Phytohabitans aurantiacus]GLI00890.1 type II secretion system protein [Phytohabitans aurantiacus]